MDRNKMKNLQINYIHLDETPSTNSHLATIADEARHGTVVFTDRQTAGRGQRGNSWESEPGKNVTMSVLLRDTGVAPARQFLLSEACALAIVDTMRHYIGETTIKWPNDIYYGDCKLCGILIEHALAGSRIKHTIVGIGLNVNQRKFLSDAPNPISMYQIAGSETPVRQIVEQIAERLLSLVASLPDDADAMHERFKRALYRSTGQHEYIANVRSTARIGAETLLPGQHFHASIIDVEPSGTILLRTATASHAFAFKEISFVI